MREAFEFTGVNVGDLRNVVVGASEPRQVGLEALHAFVGFAGFLEIIVGLRCPIFVLAQYRVAVLFFVLLAQVVSRVQAIFIDLCWFGEKDVELLMRSRIILGPLRKAVQHGREVILCEGLHVFFREDAHIQNGATDFVEYLNVLRLVDRGTAVVELERVNDRILVVYKVDNEGSVLSWVDTIEARVSLDNLNRIADDLIHVHRAELGLVKARLELVGNNHEAIVVTVKGFFQRSVLSKADGGIERLFGVFLISLNEIDPRGGIVLHHICRMLGIFPNNFPGKSRQRDAQSENGNVVLVLVIGNVLLKSLFVANNGCP